MNHSESIKQIAAALAAFQREVKDPTRNGENPHFKSKYVQLDGLLAAVRPILANHGLSLMQSTGGDGVNISVSTLIMHTSGEWIETEPLVLKAQQATPQGAGSACTYGRRFSLSAALGVAWDDDDDGNAASAQKPAPKAEDKPAPKTEDKPAPKAKAGKADSRAEYMAKIKAAMQSQHISADDGKAIWRLKFGAQSTADLNDSELKDLAENIVNYAVELMGTDDEKLMEGV